MPIISTGQFTIVDQNDAKPILANISANGSVQQAYSKDNGVDLFTPNWVSSPITLTANIYVGGVDVTDGASVTNKIWSTTFNGASIGTARTYVRNTNFATTDISQTYYFTATYTDPTTSIVSRIDAQITLSLVKTGSNAVFIQTSGVGVIRDSNTTTKNVGVIKANLVRSSGFDTDNLQFRWYTVASNGTATQIDATTASTNYGIKSIAVATDPTAAATDLGAATFTTAGITGAGVWSTSGSPGYNTLVISQEAITSYQLFKVEVRDANETATVYTAYFTVTDVTDPYTIIVTSSAGDRFKDGLGNSTLTATVYTSASAITNYAGWTFDWYIRDKNGNRTAFVAGTSTTPDLTRTIAATNGNTTGTVTITSAATLAAGDLVKLVSLDGATIKVAQVAASTGTTVTLQTATGDNLNVNPVSATGLVANEFNGGTLYKAISKKTTTASNQLVVTQYDVDVKATFTVDANRP